MDQDVTFNVAVVCLLVGLKLVRWPTRHLDAPYLTEWPQHGICYQETSTVLPVLSSVDTGCACHLGVHGLGDSWQRTCGD